MERDGRCESRQALSRISTHTLTWSVTASRLQVLCNLFISTHTLTWSVTVFLSLGVVISIISTHTLTWSVTHTFYYGVVEVEHFNSHAHVERDKWYAHTNYKHHISTHTLTWSVTMEEREKECNTDISTHTLTWSVT